MDFSLEISGCQPKLSNEVLRQGRIRVCHKISGGIGGITGDHRKKR